jgi:hypothetical protein
MEQFVEDHRDEYGAEELSHLLAKGKGKEVIEAMAAILRYRIVPKSHLNERLVAAGFKECVLSGYCDELLRTAGIGEVRIEGVEYWVGDFAGLPELFQRAMRLVQLRRHFVRFGHDTLEHC